MLRYVTIRLKWKTGLMVIQNVSHSQADRNTPKSIQKSQLHIVIVVCNFIFQFNTIF